MTGFGDDGVDKVTSAGIPGGNSGSSPGAIPVPASPSLSAQGLSSASPSLSVQLRAPASSFDRNCVQPQACAVDQTPYDELTWDRPDEGFRRKDARRF